MLNGLLICTGSYLYKNIGDYIQSIAAKQFSKKIDILVEREKLNTFHAPEKVKVIMNGWFMWNPQNWPPTDDIEPLLTSMHIVPQIAEKMLTEDGIKYFKKYAPVGCRDTGTMKILQSKGIDCYFSGCLTLTLGLEYKSTHHSKDIIFVDPYYDISLKNRRDILCVKKIIKNSINLIKNWNIAKQIKRKGNFICEHRTLLRKISLSLNDLWCIATFYETYKKIFSDEVLLNAKYISHNVPQSLFKNEDDKFNFADKLLREYAQAQFVVTSRIHCALPCLGMEAPVLFVTSNELANKSTLRSSGRFGGLSNLFHTIEYKNNSLTVEDQYLKSRMGKNRKIDTDFTFQNKPDYIPIKDKLIEICRNFMKD